MHFLPLSRAEASAGATLTPLIPAKAGTKLHPLTYGFLGPAFAGMSGSR